MSSVIIPYQNSKNKQVFDYMLATCNQLNNTNLSEDVASEGYHEDNHTFLIIYDKYISLYANLSVLKEDGTFDTLTDIWTSLEDVEFFDDYRYSLDTKIYSFDIKKFFSTLSFSSNYKDRNKIKLYFEDDNIVYILQDSKIKISLAREILKTSSLYQEIKNKFSQYEYYLYKKDISKNNIPFLTVDPVDKNSFLLPYANHKDCLNFSVCSTNCFSKIFKDELQQSFIYATSYLVDYNTYLFYTKLREDKFNFTEDFSSKTVNLGLWQTLVILQGIKFWNKFSYFTLDEEDKEVAILYLSESERKHQIFHIYQKNKDCKESSDFISKNYFNYAENFVFVGKVYANEIFLLNKLFSNPKTSFLDFSNQCFTGNSENSLLEDRNTVSFIYQTESKEILPLKVSFAELKHYIGSDLSQKDFILHFYTNGTQVLIQKWNKNETVMENMIIFDHNGSKAYLGV